MTAWPSRNYCHSLSLSLFVCGIICVAAVRPKDNFEDEYGGDVTVWKQWRYGEGETDISSDAHTADGAYPFQDVESCQHVLKAATPGQVVEKDNCPPGLTSSHNFFSKMLEGVDHVYYLCIGCSTIQIPTTSIGKISLVNGQEIDACLRNSGASHGSKVTAAHKWIIAHARKEGFATVAVMEEDFASDALCTAPQVHEDDAVFLMHEQDSTLIRLAYWWWGPTTTCPEECICTHVNSAMCKTHSGCQYLHSSAGYILKAGGFDTFLNATGIIDTTVLGAFPSLLIVPALGQQTYETGHMHPGAAQATAFQTFKDRCIMHP